jgi:N-acetyl-anhydromuramyl-L-alanine amidase AmpD
MKPTHIIIHHSLTEDGKTVSWGAIRDYHVKTNGWRDIGYHFGIELVGDHYEILVGREATEEGAHCADGGMNRCSLGICMIGNFDLAAPPDAQIQVLVRHVRSLMLQFGIPKENVKRHHDYSPKSCPGKLFPWTEFLALL